jgi:energy-coupling factor transport system permease protein
MSIFASGAGPDLDTPAARLNPVAKIVAIAVISGPLLLSRDVTTSAIMVGAQLVALPLLGLGPRLLVRAWPFVTAIGGLWLANFLVTGSVHGLLGVSLRLLALGLPGLVLVLSTDPVDLADALVQKWHAPPRFAYGALAAFRLIPLLAAELVTMRRARRARGVGAGLDPVSWLRTAVALLFALLVQAIRRAVRLAAAMDGRGFDVHTERTFARRSVLRSRDWWFMAGAVGLAVVAVGVSVATGSWRFLLG